MSDKTRPPKTPPEMKQRVRADLGEPQTHEEIMAELRWVEMYYLWCMAWDMHQVAIQNGEYENRPTSETQRKSG